MGPTPAPNPTPEANEPSAQTKKRNHRNENGDRVGAPNLGGPGHHRGTADFR